MGFIGKEGAKHVMYAFLAMIFWVWVGLGAK